MAITSPDNIWTPDSGDNYALTTDLAAMADTVQDALTKRANYYVGTTSELAGVAATAPEGAAGYDTTLDKEVRLIGGAWIPGVSLGPLAVPDHTDVTGVEGMVVTNTTSDQTYVYLNGAWHWVPANRPRLAMRKDTTQSVNPNTEATVTFTSTSINVGNGFDHSAGTFTALRDGLINIRVSLIFSPGSGGILYQVRVPRNSDIDNPVLFSASSTRAAYLSSSYIPVSAGDQFKLRVLHNNATALTVTEAYATEPVIDFMYVG